MGVTRQFRNVLLISISALLALTLWRTAAVSKHLSRHEFARVRHVSLRQTTARRFGPERLPALIAASTVVSPPRRTEGTVIPLVVRLDLATRSAVQSARAPPLS